MNNAQGQLKQIGIAAALRGSQLLLGLPSEDIDSIAQFTHLKSLEKGDYLFREGEPSCGFYIVQRGAINVHRVSAAGKEQVIHVFRSGESFAEATLATEKGYPGDARAVSASQVLLVQKDAFLALLRRRPDLALRMLGSMSAHLRVLVGQLEDLTLKDVETRLANWLLKRCANPKSIQPAKIELGMTKRVLAAEIGTVSETLSRTLARFREERLLEVDGRTVTICSPSRLAQLLERNLHG
jgi:CRP-like cAMP-binding protein